MAAPLAKLSVGRPGLGAAHASYITRISALEPERNERESSDSQERDHPLLMVHGDHSEPESFWEEATDEGTDEPPDVRDGPGTSAAKPDADPIWTWNAPDYITGDSYGMRSEGPNETPKNVQSHDRFLADKMTSGPGHNQDKLPLKEKIENARCYFGSHEELEKARGGRTHYRMVLSFDVPATNSQIRELTNDFLGQTFPKAMAFAAIHRDTDHPHVHVYIHSRQIDGKRINLKSQDYRTIDEKWSKIYSEFAGDRGIHAEHLRKKEETREWKRAAAIAYQRGERIPPKPERDSDRRQHLAEQRLSAARSAAKDRGEQLGPRPPAEPVIRPKSERETGRMLALEHVSRERLAHLIRIDAPQKDIKAAATNAQGLTAVLEKTIKARQQMGKLKLPAAAYTIEEGRQLAEYHRSREPLRDEHATGRLVAQQNIAGAELMHSQRKAEAFEALRHLWKFELEGQDNKLSLRDIEKAIDQKRAERLQLFNFMRPSKREAIESQIDYLGDLKKDVQEKLSTRAVMIDRDVKTAELWREAASKQLKTLVGSAPGMTVREGPRYTIEELNRLSEIANFNRDPHLLRHVHEVAFADTPASVETAGLMVGRSVMAKLEMLKAHDRLQTADKYQAARHAPIRDAQGMDHARSLRQVEPKTAVEVLIRHFTDTPEQKQELESVRAAASEQLKQAQAEFFRAQQYVIVREEIARDYCYAAGVSPNQIPPILTRDQIRELKQYAQNLPGRGAQKREFAHAISVAEQRQEHGAGATSGIVPEFPGDIKTAAQDQRSIGQASSAVNRLLKVVGIDPSGRQNEAKGDSHEHGPDRGFGRSLRGSGANRKHSEANTKQYEPGRNSPTAGADHRSAGGAVPEDRTGTGQDRRAIQPARDAGRAEHEGIRRSIRPVPGAHAEGHDRGPTGGNTVPKRSSPIQQPGRGSQPAAIDDNIERRGLSEARRGVGSRIDTTGGAGVHEDLREVGTRHQSAEVRELSRDLVDRGSGPDRSNTRGAPIIPTDPRATSTDGVNQPGQRLSALERLQRMVGIETQREKAERERLATLFQIDRTDPNQPAGIARGEQMVRAVQYSVLMKTDPEKAREEAPIMREQSLQAKGVIAEYRDQTGREPAPILSPEQRDYLTANRDALDSQAQREALREGLERAMIGGEAPRGVSLHYELLESHRQETKSQPQRDYGGDSLRG